MPPHFGISPDGQPYPALPIVSPDEVRRSQRDKYGGLFYLGIAGLAVVVALITWFAYSAWSLREVWHNIYVLHDRRRPEAERINAAVALSRDRRVTPRQLWDMTLRKDLPPLARYVVAEALPAQTVADNPRAYALSVARSEGWPDWLRLLVFRPLAYAAAEGMKLPREPLEDVRRRSDPAIVLWATFALAASGDDPQAAAALKAVATGNTAERELAEQLDQALHAQGSARRARLDEATRWIRSHQPEAARLWNGWTLQGDRIVPAPKLR